MIIINMDKAKAIGHQMRRSQREAEFAPLDAVIAKQIPGDDAVAAEKARQKIRDRYAAVQEAIDAAVDIEEIKSALGLE
jgi:hypothetical protein